ncbi:MAG: hypothetical protein ACM3ZQ_06950 [Bacillota bacterium]
MEKKNANNHDCCGGGKHNHGNQGGHGKHMIWMMLACMIPLALAFIFPRSGISRFLAPLMVLLCPLSHILMMGGLMKAFKKPDEQASQSNSLE